MFSPNVRWLTIATSVFAVTLYNCLQIQKKQQYFVTFSVDCMVNIQINLCIPVVNIFTTIYVNIHVYV